jgi:hypothetical protein
MEWIGCRCEIMDCKSCRESFVINFEKNFKYERRSYTKRNFNNELKLAMKEKNYLLCEQLSIHCNEWINYNHSFKKLLEYSIEKWVNQSSLGNTSSESDSVSAARPAS